MRKNTVTVVSTTIWRAVCSVAALLAFIVLVELNAQQAQIPWSEGVTIQIVTGSTSSIPGQVVGVNASNQLVPMGSPPQNRTNQACLWYVLTCNDEKTGQPYIGFQNLQTKSNVWMNPDDHSVATPSQDLHFHNFAEGNGTQLYERFILYGSEGSYGFKAANSGCFLSMRPVANAGGQNGLIKGIDESKNPVTWQKDWETFSIKVINANPATVAYPAGEVPSAPTLYIPKSMFSADGNNAISIGVGSRKGELYAVAVKNDGMLYTYNQYSLSADPWTKMDAQDASGVAIAPLDSASVSSDGALWVLNKAGHIYKYDWKNNAFQAVPSGLPPSVTFNALSVGNAYEIWAVDSNNNIYRYATTDAETGKGWMLITSGVAADVAVAADSTVMAINTTGQVFTYAGKKQWRQMEGVTLDSIAVASKGQAWGTMNGNLWQYSHGSWQQVNDGLGKPVLGVQSVAVNAANAVMLIDRNGGIWTQGDAGVNVLGAPSSAALAAAAANAMPTSGATAVKTEKAPSKKASRAALRKQGKVPAAKKAAAAGKKAARRTDATKQAIHKKAAKKVTKAANVRGAKKGARQKAAKNATDAPASKGAKKSHMKKAAVISN